MGMHPGQLDVTEATVRALVDQQFPAWRDLPVRALPSQGTVNDLFRLGEGLVARFPLVPGEVEATRSWLEAEARAARELLGRTRFPTPEPVALGAPGPGYPLPWSVQTWVAGTVATQEDPAGSVAFAHDLAQFIRDVRAIPTRGRTFRGSGRGASTSEEWDQPTPPSASSPPGTYSTPVRDSPCGPTWTAAIWSGRAAPPGHSSKPLARFGTTSTATRP